jgi:hypothetical protein
MVEVVINTTRAGWKLPHRARERPAFLANQPTPVNALPHFGKV